MAAFRTLLQLAPFIDPQIITGAWVVLFVLFVVRLARPSWGRPQLVIA